MGFIILIVIIIIIILLLLNANSYNSHQSRRISYTRQLGNLTRQRDKQATGKVTSLDSTRRTGQYGRSYITYTITYSFKAEDEKTYTGRQSVGSRKLAIGSFVTVYYSPSNPNRNRINY